MLIAVLDHTLEFGAVVGLGRLRPVDVIPDDLDAIEIGILQTLAELPLDTCLILLFRTESGVYYGFHLFMPPFNQVLREILYGDWAISYNLTVSAKYLSNNATYDN